MNILTSIVSAAEIKIKIDGPGDSSITNPGLSPGLVFANVISTAIAAMTIIAAVWFLFQIILGGMAIMNAGGDANKLAGARQQITNGFVGLIVILSATALVAFVGWILGVENILNINKWINTISLP